MEISIEKIILTQFILSKYLRERVLFTNDSTFLKNSNPSQVNYIKYIEIGALDNAYYISDFIKKVIQVQRRGRKEHKGTNI